VPSPHCQLRQHPGDLSIASVSSHSRPAFGAHRRNQRGDDNEAEEDVVVTDGIDRLRDGAAVEIRR
jgi:hypothetical protein